MIEKIIKDGYEQAAASLSLLTGEPVAISGEDIKIYNNNAELKSMMPVGTDQIIVKTEIIGELGGASWLIFDQEESRKVVLKSHNTFGVSSGLADSAILLEIDNILSAAVITQLSNVLNVRIYGDVPHIVPADFKNMFQCTNDEFCLFTTAHFTFLNDMEVKPKFIWRMDNRISELEKSDKV